MPSKIEWTDETWNLVTGCTKVSAGCANCYAERMARRLAGRYGYPKKPHQFDVTLHPDKLDVPLRWRKPRMVFVGSMGDLFHKDVPEDFIVSIFARMTVLTEHTFQVLTKQSERMRDFIIRRAPGIAKWANVWLGVSAEDQRTANERIPLLLQTPAAVRFVSFEPLLDDVAAGFQQGAGAEWIDWAIVGGESGSKARPMHPDWVRALREWALCWGIPFFFKQWGQFIHTSQMLPGVHYTDGDPVPRGDYFTKCTSKAAAGRLLDGREWNEMPEDDA